MKKFLKYLMYVGGAILILVVWALSGKIGEYLGRSTVENFGQRKQQGAVEKAQELAAEEFRKNLPIQVDKTTTLQNVLSAGKTAIYQYRISLKKSDLDIVNFRSQMKENLLHNVCQQKQMKYILDLGGNYKYIYMSSDGLFIGEITIKSSDC